MYVTLGVAKEIPRVTTETPAPFKPFPLELVNDPKTSEFGAICRIYTKVKGGHSIGTGFLITTRHVLTCAHVIQPRENPNVESITVFVAQNGPADAKNGIKTDGWAINPGWSPRCCRSDDEDYGIIRLSKPVTSGHWWFTPFDPRVLAGKAAFTAGYPVRATDPEAQFMYRSKGLIRGSTAIEWCSGQQLRWPRWTRIDTGTRLVWHLLDTARSMSGGPMWSFIDYKRVIWGLHEADIDGTNKRAILFNRPLIEQVGRWVSRGLTAP
jgi:hypothetical protein